MKRLPMLVKPVLVAPMLMTFVLMTFALGGCSFIPVRDQTLKNANGGTITCKQVGRGVASYWIGKSEFEDCVAKAHADGYQ